MSILNDDRRYDDEKYNEWKQERDYEYRKQDYQDRRVFTNLTDEDLCDLMCGGPEEGE